MEKKSVINEFVEIYARNNGNPPQNLIDSLGIIYDVVEDLEKRSAINVANIAAITTSFDNKSDKHISISSYYSNNGFRKKFVDFLAKKFDHKTETAVERENCLLKKKIKEYQSYDAIVAGRIKAEQERIEYKNRAETAENIILRWLADGQITMDTDVEEIIGRSGKGNELLSSEHMDLIRISNLSNYKN